MAVRKVALVCAIVLVALATASAAAAALIWTLPSALSAEAQGPSGAVVSYSASAVNPAGKAQALDCQPPSGATFPLGATTVTCTVTAGDGTTESQSFVVTVSDTLPPSMTPMADQVVEADGPAGSSVTYISPTAVDLVDGAIPVGCTPNSGAMFPLGTTTVSCSAFDSRGNMGTTSAQVRVVDTTPPTLNVPAPVTVEAGAGKDAVASTDPVIAAFLAAPTARDIVTPQPQVTVDAPSAFPIGTTTVTFTASDTAGNTTTRTSSVTVKPGPAAPAPTPPAPQPSPPGPAPPPPDATPPADVTAATIKATSHRVDLSWRNPADRDFDHVSVTRAPLSDSGTRTMIYEGKAAHLTDKAVSNGTAYRYVIVAVDKADNRSAGVALTATPAQQLLRAPTDGAYVAAPPTFSWTATASTTYYNIQLFRNGQKILTAWPNRPRFSLKRVWKYNGQTYTFAAGSYRWYVWPGLGPRDAGKYGQLLGSRSFKH